jgi:hypothetical protein
MAGLIPRVTVVVKAGSEGSGLRRLAPWPQRSSRRLYLRPDFYLAQRRLSLLSFPGTARRAGDANRPRAGLPTYFCR